MRTFFILLTFLALAPAQASQEAWIWPSAYEQMKDFSGVAYVLQGRILPSGQLYQLGPSPWPWPIEAIHLVFRMQKRPRTEQIITLFQNLAEQWESKGVKVEGLQLDYDALASL